MAFKIGTTLVGMVTLESLGIQDPKDEYLPYAEIVHLDSGQDRGLGAPKTTWRWGVISQAKRDVLRTYMTGVSGMIYIQTRTNESSDSYDDFLAIYHWPLAEQKDGYRRTPFEIEFTHMVTA